MFFTGCLTWIEPLQCCCTRACAVSDLHLAVMLAKRYIESGAKDFMVFGQFKACSNTIGIGDRGNFKTFSIENDLVCIRSLIDG